MSAAKCAVNGMDISAWLRGLGLERYEQAFRENAIDEAILPKLTAEDLRDLGVTAAGHRHILLDRFQFGVNHLAHFPAFFPLAGSVEWLSLLTWVRDEMR
jgi:hypothetical protein